MIQETLSILCSRHNIDLGKVYIEDLRIGVFSTALKLSNGYYGMAATHVTDSDRCAKLTRKQEAFSPGFIKGQNLEALYKAENNGKFISSLQIASLNALSVPFLTSDFYKTHTNTDPYDLIDWSMVKNVVVVGAFRSYMKKLSTTSLNWNVIELNEQAVPEEFKSNYIPADSAELTNKKADVAFLTGFSLVNNSFSELVKQFPEDCQIIVVGPSVSFLPDALFKQGVDIVGASQITKGEELMDLVSQGASGFHILRNAAKKICLQRK